MLITRLFIKTDRFCKEICDAKICNTASEKEYSVQMWKKLKFYSKSQSLNDRTAVFYPINIHIYLFSAVHKRALLYTSGRA